jgi:hypothetical protein
MIMPEDHHFAIAVRVYLARIASPSMAAFTS